MSDRNDLENALLKVEATARPVVNIADAEDAPMSARFVAALHGLNSALDVLDALRATIRERTPA